MADEATQEKQAEGQPPAASTRRPAVFTKPAPAAHSLEPQLSITGRLPAKRTLTPLEKSLVDAMQERGEEIPEDLKEAYEETQRVEAQRVVDAQARAIAREEAEAARAAAEALASEAESSSPEPQSHQATDAATERPAPSPEPTPPAELAPSESAISEEDVEEIPPERRKPRIVKVQAAPAEPAHSTESVPASPQPSPVESPETKPEVEAPVPLTQPVPSQNGMHAHRARRHASGEHPTAPKPRLVSVVDYGVVANSRKNLVEEKLDDIARDLRPQAPGPGTPIEASSRPLTREEQRQQAAELARKIFAQKQKERSLLHRFGKMFGFDW